MKAHATPGGPPVELSISDSLRVLKFSVGLMDNNAYLLIPDHGPCILIDAPTDSVRIREIVADHLLSHVITTHAHQDHIGALAEVIRTYGAEAVCGRPDAAAIERMTGVKQKTLWNGDVIPIGASFIDVIGLVGHTPGSIALATRSTPTHVFSGDSLFPGGVGKTSSDKDFRSLLADVTDRLFSVFDDDTVIHPGHGDSTILGTERPYLKEWAFRGW